MKNHQQAVSGKWQATNLLKSGICVFVIALACAMPTPAQVATGTPPFGSFSGGPDVVNNANLNVHLSIPVVEKPGRGLPFYYILSYDSSVWSPINSNGVSVWTPAANWGWRAITEAQTGYVSYVSHLETCYYNRQPYQFTIYNDWTYHDSLGVGHAFGGSVATTAPCENIATQYTTAAIDGSGWTIKEYNSPSADLYSASGQVVSPPVETGIGSGSTTDPNGNTVSVAYSNGTTTFTDTLATTALTVSGSNPLTYTYTDTGGTNRNITVNYTNQNIQTSFGCSGITEYSAPNVPLVSSIVFPNGTSYGFTYDGAARLTKVTLPTGGWITYAYTGGNNGITCADGTTATLTRTVNDNNGNNSQWTYAHTEQSTNSWTTTITDPKSKVTTLTFCDIFELSRTFPDSLGSVTTAYNSTCGTGGLTQPITQRTVTTTLPGLSPSETNTTYNTYGLPTETDEYDYGPTLARKKLITYNPGNNCGVTNPNIVDRPCKVQVEDKNSTVVAETDNTYDGNGNLTQTSSGGLTRYFSYNSNGTVATSTDVNNTQTTYSYNGSGGCANAFVTGTSVTVSPGDGFTLTTSAGWNCNSGEMTSSIDLNSNTTTYTYNDPLNRLTNAGYPDSGQKTYTYYPNTSSPTILESSALVCNGASTCGGQNLTHQFTTTLDGLGRAIKSQDNSAGSEVDTAYDALGRVYTVTVANSGAEDTYSYDALGRVTQIQHADQNKIGYSYSNNCETITDEAGKQRTLCYDGLGRLTSAADATGTTSYTYNVLDELTGATQGSQTRSYQYDSLGRLQQETNPESGTTYYSYYASGSGPGAGDLYQRTDARNITTTYYYDALHRLTSKAYSDGTPPASFWYDYNDTGFGNWWQYNFIKNGLGRLTNTCTSTQPGNCSATSTGTVYSYDSMGRVTGYEQCTPYNCGSSVWQMTYTYDLAGDVIKWSHPAGFTITNQMNAAQQITQVQSSLSDSTHPNPLVPSITYTPWGAVSTLQDGCVGCSSSPQESYYYNNRLQPYVMTFYPPTGGYCIAVDYYGTGTPSDYSKCSDLTQATSGNNGDIRGYAYQDGSNLYGHQATFTYDGANRLSTAAANPIGGGSLAYNQGYSYDQYGNMTCNQGWSGLCISLGYGSGSQDDNQMKSIGIGNPIYPTYDAAGNLTWDGTNSYQWDAEGRLKSMNGTTFTYNALGELARRSNGIQYAWDAAGHQLGTYNDGGVWWEQLIWAGNRELAYYFPGAFFIHQNYLGSNTMITNYAGGVYSDSVFYPWGQIWQTGDGWRNYFAGFQRYEDDLGIYTPVNRSYFPTYGRWPSPDPLGGDITNPQSLNRYAYALNNPTTLTDPLGLQTDCTQMTCISITTWGTPSEGPNGTGYSYLGAAGDGRAQFPVLVFRPGPCGAGGCGGSQLLALNLSIRAPGQSFGQCMGANANTYSLGGAGELALDDLFNKNTSYSSTTLGKFAAGNSISSLLWGSAGDTAQTAATSTPSLVNAAMGSPLTYGRRTTDIFDLNLLGKGGVPQALSSGARDVKSFLGDLDNVLNLGMDATTKLGIDTAFTGAEAIGCGIPW